MNGPTALLVVSVTLPAVGFLAAAAIRLVLGRRHRWQLGRAASTLCGIVGAGITALAMDRSARQAPVAVVLGGLVGTALVFGAAEWLARRRAVPAARPPANSSRPARAPTWSSSPPRGSTGGGRNARLEQVIAASTAAFFNTRGGTLLIGVADDGRIDGVEADYSLLRNPGRDGYELWLHDLLATRLGASAAATVQVEFDTVDRRDICLIRVPAAPRPVFLQVPKQRGTEFVVRVGNSSRRLDARELFDCAVTRWGARALRGRTVPARSSGGPDGGVSAVDTGPAAPSAPQPVRLAPNAPTNPAL